MIGRRRDLLVALAVGVCFIARTLWAEEPLSTILLLMCVAICLAYTVAVWRLRRREYADFEFRYPAYILLNPAGFSLCTAEPSGGFLAVFTSLDLAVRFVAIRQLTHWAPTPIGRAQLLDLLHSAKQSNRVSYVMIDPLSDDRQDTLVFPLSRCIERLGR